MIKNENYNFEPRRFTGKGIKKSFIPSLKRDIGDRRYFFRLEHPYFLHKSIEMNVTNWRGYTYAPFKQSGKEISNEELQEYFGILEEIQKASTRQYEKGFTWTLFDCLIYYDEQIQDFCAYMKDAIPKLTAKVNSIKPENPRKRSLLQRIFSLSN